MEIIRAGFNDIDIFNKDELDFGGCCFYSEDKAFRYFFEINGCEATIFTNTEQYIFQVIDEFLFYSSFITLVKNEHGHTLLEKKPSEPYLFNISKIQPSQFFINEKKLGGCKKWITKPADIFIPVVIKDDITISLDGHTRMRAALDLGYDSVYVYADEYDETIFHFVNEAINRKINTVSDMDIISDKEYEIKWNQFCNDLFNRLESQ